MEEAGLADNTMVVYTPTRGASWATTAASTGDWMYEESLRTPLLERWPDVVAPGSVSSELVQNLDLAPTFLDAAGVEVPPRVQGGRRPGE